jgi:hypothetical protein
MLLFQVSEASDEDVADITGRLSIATTFTSCTVVFLLASSVALLMTV